MSTGRVVLVPVGAVLGPHGVRGEVKIRSFTGEPGAILTYGSLLDAQGNVMLTPGTSRQAGDHFVVSGMPQRSREDWQAMKGVLLHVAKSDLPEPDEEEFYFDDLAGLQVEHLSGCDLGKVKAVQNFGADDLLEIVAPDGRTAYFLPFTKAVIPVVDIAGGKVIADPDASYLPEDLAHGLNG